MTIKECIAAPLRWLLKLCEKIGIFLIKEARVARRHAASVKDEMAATVTKVRKMDSRAKVRLATKLGAYPLFSYCVAHIQKALFKKGAVSVDVIDLLKGRPSFRLSKHGSGWNVHWRDVDLGNASLGDVIESEVGHYVSDRVEKTALTWARSLIN